VEPGTSGSDRQRLIVGMAGLLLCMAGYLLIASAGDGPLGQRGLLGLLALIAGVAAIVWVARRRPRRR
jgi:uncharacterized membrane protein HdeD (DUF308 family)